MICAWSELLSILPGWVVTQLTNKDRDSLNEIRLRQDQPPELVLGNVQRWLEGTVKQKDMSYCVQIASRYSPWSAATLSQGFLTASGGHRIGVCGQTVCQNGVITGFQKITSLCIRVARDYPGIASGMDLDVSTLIIGPPGWGKTTLLRDLIRQISQNGRHIAVVDERSELFPENIDSRGDCTDVITGCPKADGIDILLRTMGPAVIAVDEITAEKDCDALIRAGWCGVKVIATAHAGSRGDLMMRPVYRPLIGMGLFDQLIVLQQDKTWRRERMKT